MYLHSISKQGKNRANNEDNLLIRKLEDGQVLLAIADGMGGHAAGEIASKIAIDAFQNITLRNQEILSYLANLAEIANANIKDAVLKNPSLAGMGTTLTVAVINNGKVSWAHIGDTRLYHFRSGSLRQVTDDHTIPSMLVREGKITIEEARSHPMRHVLLQCIGNDQIQLSNGSFDIQEKDVLLLSTDGLHDILDDYKIAAILNLNLTLEGKLKFLVDEALRLSSKDDISVVGAEV
jgi:PPM family protein phosphatase